MAKRVTALNDEILAEQWYDFMHDLLSEIRKAYGEANRERGVNQQYIADRLGVDAALVSRWLNGRQNMTVRTLHNVARAMDCRLHVELDDLTKVQRSNSGADSDDNIFYFNFGKRQRGQHPSAPSPSSASSAN